MQTIFKLFYLIKYCIHKFVREPIALLIIEKIAHKYIFQAIVCFYVKALSECYFEFINGMHN